LVDIDAEALNRTKIPAEKYRAENLIELCNMSAYRISENYREFKPK
jgi:hypothetical protein